MPWDAAACSCVPVDPWRAYARADAALIGVFQGKRTPTTYVFRVVEDFKVELADEVEVRSAEDGASCGIESRVGHRVGLFLARAGEQWRSSLCSQARPEQVRAAAEGLPRPNGAGAVRMLVGGSFGAVKVQALDARGRPLAYGRGAATVRALAVCPGSTRSVEATTSSVGFRDLRTLRLTRSVPLRPRRGYPARVHCHGAAAFAALVSEERTRLVRVRGRAVQTVRTVRGQGEGAVAFHGRHAFLADGRRIFSLDLRSGATRTLAAFTAEQLAVSPDGSLLAALTGNRLAAIRLRSRRITRGPFLTREDTPRLVWDRHRLAVVGGERGLLYDSQLRLVGRLPAWPVGDAVGLGGRIAAVAYGALEMARLPRGPVRVLRDLISPETYAIAAVEGGPRIRLAASLACARG